MTSPESVPSRRDFLRSSAGLLLTPALGNWVESAESSSSQALKVSSFRFDCTPPIDHPLCGGLVQPAKRVDDRLEGLGIIIEGASRPFVVLSVDWTGVLNATHDLWREKLAKAVDTTKDRVLIHCVHQHDAPFACLDFNKIVEKAEGLGPTIHKSFLLECIKRSTEAVKKARSQLQPLTQIGRGKAKVEGVASNRRILGPNGKIQFWRGSSTRDPKLRELPEGEIDPWLKSLAFYSGEKRIACLHFYASHPMSYYGQGGISSDFVGLARKKIQAEDPDCTHIYLTGCAGNIACGKYNDGSEASRVRLTQRMETALRASIKSLRPEVVGPLEWKSLVFEGPPRSLLPEKELQAFIKNPKNRRNSRIQKAFLLAWHQRRARSQGPQLTALSLGSNAIVSLPAETFLEYQLLAQRVDKSKTVFTAAYGDGGPWYLPPREAYPQGGYEVSVAFCDPQGGDLLEEGVKKLLKKPS